MATGQFRTFGQWLRARRNDHGLTQGAAGGEIGTDASQMSRWEKGAGIPSRTQALAAVKVLADDDADAEFALGLLGYSTGVRTGERKGIPYLTQREGNRLANNGRDPGNRAMVAKGMAESLSDDQVAQVNTAYRLMRFKLKATGGGYDLEVRPPADDYDRDGVMQRLELIRHVERDHGKPILGDIE